MLCLCRNVGAAREEIRRELATLLKLRTEFGENDRQSRTSSAQKTPPLPS